MRFIKKLAVGAVAAAALIGGALFSPASANATTPYYTGPWGPYFSSDHKAEASGDVTVETHKVKEWYWDKKKVKVTKCWWEHGKKKCKDDWKWKKVWTWKWVEKFQFEVKGQLINHHAWGKPKYACAWATFKIETFDGHWYFKKFKNCHDEPKHFWFEGKNAEKISVKVSRGNAWEPKGYHGSWETVYEHEV
ncbi:hypothetical protein [Acrocarpospora catenulata]|uniref:hypothetical protein n=1 Tax=Acrocarpospora catenulata TaxID=2836182 RepID=UPI001BD9E84A|nr:hypothetical protein [Acrocarpospora catenulata]